jgi:hypothetical protein
VPVDVAVSLLTTKAENVEAFCWHNLANCLTDAVDDGLEVEVLTEGEVARHLFSMLLWRDEDISVQRRISVQEGNRVLVFIDDVVFVIRVPREHFADEAPPGELIADRVEIDEFRSSRHERDPMSRSPCAGAPPSRRQSRVGQRSAAVCPRAHNPCWGSSSAPSRKERNHEHQGYDQRPFS